MLAGVTKACLNDRISEGLQNILHIGTKKRIVSLSEIFRQHKFFQRGWLTCGVFPQAHPVELRRKANPKNRVKDRQNDLTFQLAEATNGDGKEEFG